MKVWGDLTFLGSGRLRGLQTAIFSDEPLAKGDAGAVGSKRVQTVTNASGAITCNWALYDEIRLETTGTVTLTFSGATDGQGCILTIKGGHGVNLPASVRYNDSVTFYVPTEGAAAIDKLGFVYDLSDTKYDFVSAVLNLA
jgi:hypothetical protein